MNKDLIVGSEASHLQFAVIVHLLGFLARMHLDRDVGLSRSRCVRRGLPISNSAGVTPIVECGVVL